VLRGKAVHLRPIKRSDLPFFVKWFNDPEVVQNLAIYLPMTEMGEEKWIEELATVRTNTDVSFVIGLPGDNSGIPIGTIGLHRIDHKNQNATFGIAIGEKECWSKGYSTEATRLLISYGFKELNLNRITSSALDFNERSIGMHMKAGFREEGQLRQSMFKNGMFRDLIAFGVLREEWQ